MQQALDSRCSSSQAAINDVSAESIRQEPGCSIAPLVVQGQHLIRPTSVDKTDAFLLPLLADPDEKK